MEFPPRSAKRPQLGPSFNEFLSLVFRMARKICDVLFCTFGKMANVIEEPAGGFRIGNRLWRRRTSARNGFYERVKRGHFTLQLIAKRPHI